MFVNNFNDKKIARQNFHALLYPMDRRNVFIFLPGIFHTNLFCAHSKACLKNHSCNMVFAVSQEGQFLFSFSVTYCVTSPSTIRINVLSSINVRFQGLMITPLISSSDSAASSTFPMSVIKVDITLSLPFSSSSKLVKTAHQFFPSEVFTACNFICPAAAFGSTAMIT